MSYSLSLKKQGEDSKLIARIKKGKIRTPVYLVKNSSSNDLKKGFDYEAVEEKMKDMKLKSRQRVQLFNELEEAFESKADPKTFQYNKPLFELYKFCQKESSDETCMKLKAGEQFEILPSDIPKKSGRYYICGMSESGKSWISKMLIENYHEMFPKRKIYVISSLKEDETLDECKKLFERINYETFLDDEPTLEEFSDDGKGSLILFDDYDTIGKGNDKKVGDILQKFIDQCCQMGRHENITTLMSTHFLTNYKLSSIKLAESNYFVVFPRNTANKKLSYLLETYASLEEPQVKIIKKMGKSSPWVLVSRIFPKYCISEKEIRILEDFGNNSCSDSE